MNVHSDASLTRNNLRSHIRPRPHPRILVLVLVTASLSAFAQAPGSTVMAQASNPPGATGNAPLTITFQDALQRARMNDPQYRSALTDLGLAREDHVQARAGLLPSVNYNNSFIYTEGTGRLPVNCASSVTGCPTSRFIANNGVHEYISQADVHEAMSLTGVADYARSSALLAQARAKAEIAKRGLVVTVTQAYYGLVVSERKYANAQRAAAEAEHFLSISIKLENGGEVAHADAIKAQIQAQQRQRDLQEAALEMQ